MSKTYINWVKKANNDLKTAKDELATENPATDTICFHCQQAVEKFLKAFLTFHDKPFRKTHNLAELLYLCIEVDRDFENLPIKKIDRLTEYSIEVRYPEEFYEPSLEEAEEAIRIAERVKEFVLEKLKL